MDKTSIFYHDIFDYPLTSEELIKWSCRTGFFSARKVEVVNKSGFFFIKGREVLISKRISRLKTSKKKLKIAENASKILSFIPTVKMVAVTGSLAMVNSDRNSDIDLMIITTKGALWTTRLFAYLLIWLFGIQTRKPNDSKEKDKLCLNVWLDESDLIWKKSDRNLYTAHEIAQIVPLINKNNTYEKFLWKNRWILEYWPNAVRAAGYKDTKILSNKKKMHSISLYLLHFISLVEKMAFKIQYLYMKNKISRETVTKTRALFHPQDWAKTVLTRLQALN